MHLKEKFFELDSQKWIAGSIGHAHLRLERFAGVEIQLVCTGKSVLAACHHLVIAGFCFAKPGPVPQWVLNILTFIFEIAFQKILLIYAFPKSIQK